MTLRERLEFCNKCEKRTFDKSVGIVCSLTNRKPNFERTCKDFKKDRVEIQKEKAKEYVANKKEAAYSFDDAPTTRKKKDNSGTSIWPYLFLIFIVIRIIIRLARD